MMIEYDATFRIGARHQLFHAGLREWREQKGLTQKQLSRMAGLNEQAIGRLETFRQYPNEGVRARLAEVTGIPADELFPSWLREWATGAKVAVTAHEVTPAMLSEPQFRALSAPDEGLEGAECETDIALLGDAERAAMEKLTPRERQVLDLRCGFTDGEPRTYGEVGQELGISRERARQIEAMALRKLRHPVQAKALRPFTMWAEEPRGVGARRDIAAWLEHRRYQGDAGEWLRRQVLGNPCCQGWSPEMLTFHVARHHPNPPVSWPAICKQLDAYKAWASQGGG